MTDETEPRRPGKVKAYVIFRGPKGEREIPCGSGKIFSDGTIELVISFVPPDGRMFVREIPENFVVPHREGA